MWQAKAPAGETHSTVYSERTCDCEGMQQRKGKRGEGGMGQEGGTGGNTRLLQCRLKYKQKWKVFFLLPQIHADHVGHFCCICPFSLTVVRQSSLHELHMFHKNIKQHLHHYVTTFSSIIQEACCKCSGLMCIQGKINHQNMLRLFLFTADFDKDIFCSK